jgi:hypothetical protein
MSPLVAVTSVMDPNNTMRTQPTTHGLNAGAAEVGQVLGAKPLTELGIGDLQHPLLHKLCHYIY